jgi:hypothetical protein
MTTCREALTGAGAAAALLPGAALATAADAVAGSTLAETGVQPTLLCLWQERQAIQRALDRIGGLMTVTGSTRSSGG